MKHLYILSAILFCTSSFIEAQSLRIIFLEKPNVEANVKIIEDPKMAIDARSQLEKMSRSTYLYYNNGESLYSKSNLSRDNTIATNDIMIVMDNNDVYYKDLKNGKGASLEYIFEKPFIIEEPLSERKWTLTNESATVAGYECKKAIDEKGNIVWYAMDIPVNDGPENYWGLPGLILKLETPFMSVTAEEVNADFDTQNIIKKPTEGKKVTREEFDTLFAKKIDEMRSNYESGDY